MPDRYVSGVIVIDTPEDGVCRVEDVVIRNALPIFTALGKTAFSIRISKDLGVSLKPYFDNATNGDEAYVKNTFWKELYDIKPTLAKRLLLYPVVVGDETIIVSVKDAEDIYGETIVKSNVIIPFKWMGDEDTVDGVE